MSIFFNALTEAEQKADGAVSLIKKIIKLVKQIINIYKMNGSKNGYMCIAQDN